MPLPYEMPSHAIGQGAAYDTIGLAAALAVLADWYFNANLMLGEARRRNVARGLVVPMVRCWPHHFDLDSLVSFGSGGRTFGLGFCPGDHYYDEPYFYASIYPGPDIATLPVLPAVGHWHDKDFTGAVATATAITAAQDQPAAVDAFLRAAADVAIKALT
jgi:hypothetical protein